MKNVSTKSTSYFSSRTKLLTIFLFFISLTLILLSSNLKPNDHGTVVHNRLQNEEYSSKSARKPKPKWIDIIKEDFNVERKNFKFGLVNVDEAEVEGLGESVFIDFDRVKPDIKWDDLFPEWIDEEEKWDAPTCPKIPMPMFDNYGKIDIVIARIPCGRNNSSNKGTRDVFRLQVNLVVANFLVKNVDENGDYDRTAYVVFIGSCMPMLEIFRCDDLVWNENEYWVYKPDLRKLKQKVTMPVGTCQLAPSYDFPGKEQWKNYIPESTNQELNRESNCTKQREAYVTLLHSSEKYVCGAIALAQSIIQTNSTKDLVLLVDDSIKRRSLLGLRSAGWKIKKIKRIRSPHAEIDAYNEWNYSKLRIFQLTEYDKVIFIDADLIVLQNMDALFMYPQVSASGNDKYMFNSGVMSIEPSECMFKTLMEKRDTISSYNGGDQGFLNEVFTWWHRWPKKVNYLKIFIDLKDDEHDIQDDLYAIHYLGLKPWMCYRDYDCNWDMLNHHLFASDMAHRRWWQVYDAMPRKLQGYCGLTEDTDARIRKWRGRAENASLADRHWKIKVSDPRQHNYQLRDM